MKIKVPLKVEKDHKHLWMLKFLRYDGETKIVWICFGCLKLEYNPSSEAELKDHQEWENRELVKQNRN